MANNIFDPVGTLSVGNVVTIGTILYKSNFKRYLLLSLRASGWWLAIVVATFGLVMSGSIVFALTRSWLGILPFAIAWLALSLYFLAKYLTDRATISRLAYQELIDAPETSEAASQQLLPRTWGFLRLSLLVGLYLFLIFIIGYIAIAAVVGLLIYWLAPFSFWSGRDWQTYAIIGATAIVLILLWVVIILRCYSAWFVAELPLAIEPTKSANFSIRRSQKLTRRIIRRVIWIMTIAFLITLPINIVTSIPGFIGQLMVTPATATDPVAQMTGGTLILAGLLLSLIVELFLMPLWQAIKAVVYYDLRNRVEGSDLVIRSSKY